MKFQIDRSKWLNGELVNRHIEALKKAPNSMLLDKEGRMCCLGFYSLACGIPAKWVVGLSEPGDLELNLVEKLAPTIAYVHQDAYEGEDGEPETECHVEQSLITDKLITANDDTTIGCLEREARIVALFADAGIEAEIVGEYPKV